MTGKAEFDVGMGPGCGCPTVPYGQSRPLLTGDPESVGSESDKDDNVDGDSVAELDSGWGNGAGAIDIAVVGGKVCRPARGNASDAVEGREVLVESSKRTDVNVVSGTVVTLLEVGVGSTRNKDFVSCLLPPRLPWAPSPGISGASAFTAVLAEGACTCHRIVIFGNIGVDSGKARISSGWESKI